MYMQVLPFDTPKRLHVMLQCKAGHTYVHNLFVRVAVLVAIHLCQLEIKESVAEGINAFTTSVHKA